MVHQLKTLAEYENFVQEHDKVVIDAFATWCGPCKRLGPIVEEASAARPNLAFAKVDIDQVQEVAQIFGITSIPTILMIEKGRLVKDNLGYLELDDLLQVIDSAI